MKYVCDEMTQCVPIKLFNYHLLFQNGALSAVPYICQAVPGFLAGQTADIIRSKRILNTTNTRKLYQITGMMRLID